MLYFSYLNKDLKEQDLSELFGFNATTYLQGNCRIELATDKGGENKGFGFAVMPEHVQKELLKLHEIEFLSNKIIIDEEATSTKLKRPDEQNTQKSITEVVHDCSNNIDLIRANTVPVNKSYVDATM